MTAADESARRVSLFPGLLEAILIASLLLALVFWIMAAGFVFASRAGKGSRRALTAWAAVAVLEVTLAVSMFAGDASFGIFPIAAVIGQGLWYCKAVRDGRGAQS